MKHFKALTSKRNTTPEKFDKGENWGYVKPYYFEFNKQHNIN
jgi:hypothetical protein